MPKLFVFIDVRWWITRAYCNVCVDRQALIAPYFNCKNPWVMTSLTPLLLLSAWLEMGFNVIVFFWITMWSICTTRASNHSRVFRDMLCNATGCCSELELKSSLIFSFSFHHKDDSTGQTINISFKKKKNCVPKSEILMNIYSPSGH